MSHTTAQAPAQLAWGCTREPPAARMWVTIEKHVSWPHCSQMVGMMTNAPGGAPWTPPQPGCRLSTRWGSPQ